MVTIKQIRGARDYFGNHLSANDYYSEGESVIGYWRGKLAEKLGLEGKPVNREDFEALRSNRHPETGEKLRPRVAAVKFHDIVISAPKSYSIVALVGGDERLVEGFHRAVEKARLRLEGLVEVRNRKGASYHTEDTIRTGNAAIAVFQHDSSRLLDPQLHTHLVFSNHSFEVESGSYLALQPKTMMDGAKQWITDQFHRDLANEAIAANYTVEFRQGRMRIQGVSLKTEYTFSTRARQRRGFERRYRKLFGRGPSQKRIEQFIKEGKSDAKQRFKNEYHAEFGKWPSKEIEEGFLQDWRSAKMAKSTKEEVYRNQREKLTSLGAEKLDGMVALAREPQAESLDHETKEEIGERNSILDTEEEASKADLNGSTKRELGIKKRSVVRKQKREQEDYRRAVGRIEAIRRMRRGIAVARALQGHPAVFMIQQLTNLRRRMK